MVATLGSPVSKVIENKLLLVVINTLRPRQIAAVFADDIFTCIWKLLYFDANLTERCSFPKAN